jgi:hypothetical protein
MKLKILGYTIDIQKVKEIERKEWTQSEIDTLVKLRSEAHSWKEIEELMNRSASDCSNKYYIVKEQKTNNKDIIKIDDTTIVRHGDKEIQFIDAGWYILLATMEGVCLKKYDGPNRYDEARNDAEMYAEKGEIPFL